MNTPLCDDQVIATLTQAMDDDKRALRLLSEALMMWPKDHRLWCLRGSIYASRGQRAQACVDLAQTLTLAPDFSVARFMLGLLELLDGRPLRAASVWESLDALPPTDALRLFAQGLLALADERFDDAHMTLTQGLAAEQPNPHLLPYIQAVIREVEMRLAAAQTNDLNEIEPALSSHLFLASYLGDLTRH